MGKKIVNNIDKVSKNIFLLAEDKISEVTPYYWDNMPEFIQNDFHPYACIEVEIKTKEDFEEFIRIINDSSITEKTKAIWFPKKNRFENSSYRYFGTIKE